MRRGSSTVVALVGDFEDTLLPGLARSSNLTVVRPGEGDGLQTSIRAFREAAGKASPYVLVAADPLAEVAEQWRAMWDLEGRVEDQRPGLEPAVGEVLEAWRGGRLELPDYYLVVTTERLEASGDDQPPALRPYDLHLGVLHSARPSRVVAVVAGELQETRARILRGLRSLPAGPWWPPLDEIVEAARTFFAGAPGGIGSGAVGRRL